MRRLRFKEFNSIKAVDNFVAKNKIDFIKLKCCQGIRHGEFESYPTEKYVLIYNGME